MKQVVIISGKGGTGKTFVSASLACVAENAVYADCDVDAANLHLLLKPVVLETHDFAGGKVAEISKSECTGCGICPEYCRFDALTMNDEGTLALVDPVACEGCGVCGLVCPVDAIDYRTSDAGQWYVSSSEYGPMVYAHLYAGEENSGKLVQQVRERAEQEAKNREKDWVVVDGPPGTGCPVMSALTGVDFAVLVTEPTVAGSHDLKRVVELAGHFSIPVGMVVNKSTINPEGTEELREFAEERNIRYLGEIPYDKEVVTSVADLEPYACTRDDHIAEELKSVWKKIRMATDATVADT